MEDTEDKPKPIIERVTNLEEAIYSGRIRKLRLPSKAKVSKGRLKKGWISVFRIGENGNLTPTKVQIDGSVFDFLRQQGHYHTTDGREILFWKGKPCLFQEDKKLNPKFFKFNEGENETYGQKKIIAAILKDTITKRKGGSMKPILIIAIIAVIGYILGKYVFKWF